MQDCHIDIKEEDVTELMVEEGFCHEAEAIMRVDTFKRCLLHVSLVSVLPGQIVRMVALILLKNEAILHQYPGSCCQHCDLIKYRAVGYTSGGPHMNFFSLDCGMLMGTL